MFSLIEPQISPVLAVLLRGFYVSISSYAYVGKGRQAFSVGSTVHCCIKVMNTGFDSSSTLQPGLLTSLTMQIAPLPDSCGGSDYPMQLSI